MRLPALLPALALVGLAAPVLAAETLPLVRGAYVDRESSCRDPANAVLRDYNGQGIGSRNAAQCRGRVIARIGARYTLMQTCVSQGGGPARRITERLKIRVDTHTAFTDIRTGAHYRLCPGVRP